MLGLRRLIRPRRLGCAVALCLAYSLAIQALMASVGLGMSAFAAADQAGLVICSFASTHPGAAGEGPQKPSPTPQCSFCFVAAQTVGHIALAGEALTFPAYAGLLILGVPAPIGNRTFFPQFRRAAGNPRAPPAFSV